MGTEALSNTCKRGCTDHVHFHFIYMYLATLNKRKEFNQLYLRLDTLTISVT